MATAVKNAAEVRPASPEARLPAIGLFGALYLIASVAAVVAGLPYLWATGVTPSLEPSLGTFLDQGLKVVAQVGLAVILGVFGVGLQGANPVEGARGAVFVGVSTIVTVFFFTRAVAMWVEASFLPAVEQRTTGLVVTGLIALAFAWLGWKFLRSRRARRWMLEFDRAGWLSFGGFKKTQGQRVRRLTMLGILILLGSGVYVLMSSNTLASYDNGFFRGTPLHATKSNDYVLAMPFSDGLLNVLPNVKFTLPVLLAGLALWFAYRAVNYPRFADFLIATEAEMNKVSWTPRKQLFKDTIVVLVMVLFITVFLLLVDLFWGWILSSRLIGVLPSAPPTKQAEQQVEW